jgi:5-methylcytosine-specific restriction endonuclease McrA
MQKHIKNFLKHYKIGLDEYFPCQYCRQAQSVDIHHIKGRLGENADNIENLIGLCRQCHMRAHKQQEPYISEQELLNCI